MKFIDTHTHLYDESLITDESAMINRSMGTGVRQMYMPNCDSTTIAPMLRIADEWKDHCLPMMGLHPVYVKDNYREELAIVKDWLSRRRFYAMGEIGLDKHWDLTHLEQQKETFALQIDWALEYDLPIVIHSREATQDCIEIVRAKQNGQLKGIFHCFSGTPEEASEIISLGFLLGIGGVVTFKKSTLQDVVKATDLKHMVLETDAPYLAPVPYRGKRNESSYIPLIAEKIAELKEVPIEEVAIISTANAEKVFANPMI
jgi:TatD DNase family protein